MPPTPHILWSAPFALLLLAIAILPLLRKTHHWWERNRNRLLVSASLGAVVLLYYGLRGYGWAESKGAHASEPGFQTLWHVAEHALLREYFPFFVLLFSLYVIAGGLQLRGDLLALPSINTAFLAIGSVLASIIGTTGASMLLIRPLLQTNHERKYRTHTVIFFIFLVSNIGGLLTPLGDPPLFLGYLRGVPFLWTLRLWKAWVLCVGVLLALYFVWDQLLYRRETMGAKKLDVADYTPLRLRGAINFVWLAGVILVVMFVVPNQKLVGTNLIVSDYVREALMLGLVGLSLLTTPKGLRKDVEFAYGAIVEVACLFLGIFVTMQVPLEILKARGPELGLASPMQFFWGSGILSSLLDNAPTYVVFLETAVAITPESGHGLLRLLGNGLVRTDLLAAISLGSVLMGANTYIGNGPNFMVRSIAESRGVKMPSFFGYMAYSTLILLPLFVVVSILFCRS